MSVTTRTKELPPMSEDADTPTLEESWDARYRESDRVWSERPNAALVREVRGLPPGRALDLGCGEGADVIWLAQQGWRVVGTDISRVALARAAEHAAAAGVAETTAFRHHDLSTSFPEGSYDLVSACFLHSRGDVPREAILRSAAAAVAPGGVLLVVGHAEAGPSGPPPEVVLPTPQQTLAALELPEGDWEVLRSEEHDDPGHAHGGGEPTTRRNNTVMVRRLPD
jgi:SAM-dependent methyltransferase